MTDRPKISELREVLRRLCEAATSPWREAWCRPEETTAIRVKVQCHSVKVGETDKVIALCGTNNEAKLNSGFIAAARSLLPEALDEIDTLKAALRGLLDNIGEPHDPSLDDQRKAAISRAKELLE